jgi:hypothetical protein
MFNPQELVIEQFVRVLKDAYGQTYSTLERDLGNITAWTGRLALENIANSDSLYHNVDHTIMVTQVGQAILKGSDPQRKTLMRRRRHTQELATFCHSPFMPRYRLREGSVPGRQRRHDCDRG